MKHGFLLDKELLKSKVHERNFLRREDKLLDQATVIVWTDQSQAQGRCVPTSVPGTGFVFLTRRHTSSVILRTHSVTASPNDCLLDDNLILQESTTRLE